MYKNLIITIMTGSDPSYKFARMSFEYYAKKTNSDFLIISKESISLKGLSPFHFSKKAWLQKFLLPSYLESYERVLYLDADIIIHPESPNIFEIYSNLDYVYMFNEGAIENREDELSKTFKLLNFNNKELEKNIYYNAGVILFSRDSNFYKNTDFNEISKIIDSLLYFEQSYFNYLIFKDGFKHQSIDFKFNRMNISGPKDERFQSYFIHHAGGAYSKKSKYRAYTMIEDYCKLYHYQLTILDKVQIQWENFKYIVRRNLKKLFV